MVLISFCEYTVNKNDLPLFLRTYRYRTVRTKVLFIPIFCRFLANKKKIISISSGNGSMFELVSYSVHNIIIV